MSFSFNNFLGSVAGASDIQSAIQAVSDSAYFHDGSKSMTGTMSLSGNIFIGASVLEVQEQAVGILPATAHVSIYAKTDKMLYIQDDTGLETLLAGGLSGPGSSTDNRLVLWDGITGSVLKESTAIIDVAGNLSGLTGLTVSGNLTANTGDIDFNSVDSFDLLATDNTATAINIIATGGASSNLNISNTTGTGVTSVLLSSTLGSIKISTVGVETTDVGGLFTHNLNDVVSTSSTSSVDNAISRYDSTSGSLVQNSGLILDNSDDLLKGAVLWLHNKGGVGNFAAGLGALALVSTGTNNTGIGDSTLGAITTSDNTTAFGFNALLVNTADNNTAMGSKTLMANTSGAQNSAFGFSALSSVITGSNCTAMGHNSLTLNTGGNNTAMGSGALNSNIGGTNNTAVGCGCMGANTTGLNNTAMGENSLLSNVGGSGNTSIGRNCLDANNSGTNNTSVGNETLGGCTSGSGNTALGRAALLNLTSSNNVTAIGHNCLLLNTAEDNTGVGSGALDSNSSGIQNTSVGRATLASVTTGDNCTAMGHNALTNSTGSDNTALGSTSADSLTTGVRNTSIGQNSLSTITTGDDNISLGDDAGSALTTSDSDNICINNVGVAGDNQKIRIGSGQTNTFIQGISGVTPAGAAILHETVIVNASGEMGTIASYPPGHLQGLIIADASVSTKTISAGSCLSDDDTTNILSSGVLTPDISASGLNGRDTGAEVEGWWYIFILADSTGVEAVTSLLSLSSSAPTMPASHDKKRLIGAIRNNAALDLYDYYTQSTGKDRLYLWRESAAVLQVLSNGQQTTWTNVDMSEFIPPISTQLYMQGTHDGSSNTQPDFVSFRTDGSSLDGVYRVYAGSAWGSGIFHIETSSVGIIEYQNNGTTDCSNVYAVGFTLSL